MDTRYASGKSACQMNRYNSQSQAMFHCHDLDPRYYRQGHANKTAIVPRDATSIRESRSAILHERSARRRRCLRVAVLS